MMYIRKSGERGDADHGWLKSKHTFSFADYYDENHMGFGPLRVINEDWIQGGTGFSTHGHRDMEIISYVVEGALEHKDSMGHSTIIRPGEVQRMSAGTGVRHSEHNNLQDRVTHLLQIWILPEKAGIQPSYGQKSFANELAMGDLALVASMSGQNGSITLNQDVNMFAAKSNRTGEKTIHISSDRHLWVQVIKGQVSVNDTKLTIGDGAGIEKMETLNLRWNPDSEFLVFDMP